MRVQTEMLLENGEKGSLLCTSRMHTGITSQNYLWSKSFKWWTWYLSEETCKQNVEALAWLLLVSHKKIWKERDRFWENVHQKVSRTWWFEKFSAYLHN